jgi:hypothetical protein
VFNLQAGRDPVFQPFIMSELARQGKWDQKPFLEQIELQRFDLVVAQSNVLTLEATEVYTKEMLALFRKHYKLRQMVPTGGRRAYFLLVPKTEGDRKSEGDNLVRIENPAPRELAAAL